VRPDTLQQGSPEIPRLENSPVPGPHFCMEGNTRTPLSGLERASSLCPSGRQPYSHARRFLLTQPPIEKPAKSSIASRLATLHRWPRRKPHRRAFIIPSPARASACQQANQSPSRAQPLCNRPSLSPTALSSILNWATHPDEQFRHAPEFFAGKATLSLSCPTHFDEVILYAPFSATAQRFCLQRACPPYGAMSFLAAADPPERAGIERPGNFVEISAASSLSLSRIGKT